MATVSIQEFVLVALIILTLGILIHRYLITFDGRVEAMAYDGKKYKVRDTPNKQETADALARLNARIDKLIDFVAAKKDPDYLVAAQRLRTRYSGDAISEGTIDHALTSYTVNKGDQIVFCMRTRDAHDQLYDDNLLFYVAMHELAHIASVTEEHTPEFHRNFSYLQSCAKELGLFQNSNQPVNYCGIPIARY